MAEEIGVLRIDLTLDNADFTKSMSQIDTKLRGLTSEFKASAGGNKEYEKSLTGLREKNEMLGKTLDLQKTKVNALKAEYDKVADAKGKDSIEAEKLATKYNNAVAAMKKTETQIDKTTQAIKAQENPWKQAQSSTDKYAESLEKTSHKIRSFGDNAQFLGGKLSVGLTAPISAFGLAAGVAAKQFDDANAKIQMSLGVTAEEAKKLENNAKNLWKDGFGESLEEVTESLIKIKQNMKGVSDGAELEKVTRDAMLLAQTFESDVNEVTRAGNNLMVNFGIDSQTAFDLMAKGAQNGLNFSQEMFDNLAEYSGLFADMGYSADEYFQLLVNGSKAGVYNLDYINDVMKEFQIRVKDGSKGTKEAMGEMSASTQKVWKDFLAGKGTVADVSDAVLTELKGMDDQVAANQIGVALYGTKWEDLEADAMYSLTTMGSEMDKVSGTMDKMAEVQDKTFGQRWQEILRTSQTALLPLGETLLDFAEDWLPKVSSGVEKVTGWFNDLSPAAQNTTVVIGGLLAAAGPLVAGLGFMTSGIGALIAASTPLIGMFTGAGAAAGAAATGTGLLGSALTVLTGPIGIAIGAVAALGVAYALTREKADEQLKKDQELAENNLKMAESHTKVLEEKTADIDKTSELIGKTIEQAETVDKLTLSFEGLWDKSKLSREEFAEFLDLQSELANTTAPSRVEELEQRMDALREKSGLSNEQFNQLLSSNAQLVEIFPAAGEAVGEYGNRIADTTGKLQEMTQAELDRMGIEVYNKMISDLEAVNAEIGNYESLLGEIVALEDSVYTKKAEQKDIQKDIADNEATIIANNEKIAELKQRQKEDSGKEYFQLEAQKNELQLQNFELDKKNEKNNKNLEVINDTLSTESKTLEEKKKQSSTTEELIGKNRNNLDNYTKILEKNLGINIEKGKELQSLDSAIAKNQTTISQLQDRIKREGDSNGKKQESIQKLQKENEEISTAKTRLDGVIKSVDTQNAKFDAGQQKLAKVNGQFDAAKQKTDENISRTDIWNGKLDKSHTKKVEIKQSKDPDEENKKWSNPISKTINILVDGAKSLFGYAEGTDYHPGGMAFMGEEGPELFKANGLYGIANFGLYDLPQGAKVWTHDETKHILSTGFGDSWNAKGNIFSSPTIFANAGLQGVGETGIGSIPSMNNLLGSVRTAVAETMSLNQTNIPSTIVVQSILDGRVVSESITPFVSQNQYDTASIKGITKGVNF